MRWVPKFWVPCPSDIVNYTLENKEDPFLALCANIVTTEQKNPLFNHVARVQYVISVTVAIFDNSNHSLDTHRVIERIDIENSPIEGGLR